VRISKTFFRTTWRADWLIEFSVALIILTLLTKEAILAAIGVGISLALAGLGLGFHRRLGILRDELEVEQHLFKTRVFLGDEFEGELAIRNRSRWTVQILDAQPILPRELSFRLLSSFNSVLHPGATSHSSFAITPAIRGSFRITGFALSIADPRGLFTGEVKYAQFMEIEVHPEIRTGIPLTPLRLYGESAEIFRKSALGTDYAGTREYATGDEYHAVEWKATARLRKLMVKEFHPETQATLRILINAGRTMHEESYVGTKLDETLAISQLLVESAIVSEDRIGILVYDEFRITSTVKLEGAAQQLSNLHELALRLLPRVKLKEAPRQAPASSRDKDKELPRVEPLATFIRLLRLKLSLGYKQTGLYKALAEVTAQNLSPVIILTDLLTDVEPLLKSASSWPERANVIVAQVGAAWRFCTGLEDAYVAYCRNNEVLRRLRRAGITVLDARPEMLVDKIGAELLMPR
jgi:uncharacterized protein (DUF58 family)